MYTFDFPVKYIDDSGKIQDITLAITKSTTKNSKFESDANSASDSVSALNSYYETLASGSETRATIFKTYLSYSNVETQVLSELGKTLAQVRTIYPDTYDFLMSLKDGLAEIDDY